jgi:hypothetical protein
MKIDLEVRNAIAQLIVDMDIGERKPIRKREMIPIIKEVNDTALIGHAVRFVKNANDEVIALKKYRKTAIEKRFESNT